jgi:hypothetical protein
MKVLNCDKLCSFVVNCQIAHLKLESCPSLRGIVGYSKIVCAAINERSRVVEFDEEDEANEITRC